MRHIVNPKLEYFGWYTKLQESKGSAKITINKMIVVGIGLRKGQRLYCYIDRENNRPVMKTYLDGKPRDP